MKWIKKGFKDFQKGTLGNGGQNLYVSAKGVLQRIFNFDINSDGFPDIPITNSHSMNERTKIHVYDSLAQEKPLELPSNGSYDAIFADLTGDGTEDLIVACQHNGVNSDVSAVIYFGSEIGLSEKYKLELRVPNSLGVTAGDFSGCGKKSLVFISGDKLRLFNQCGYGIEAAVFEELDINAISLAAGDLDGDGYDDLYVVYKETGCTAIYWGGEDGITPERKTEFGGQTIFGDERASATTAGRKFFRWMPWRNSIIFAKGKNMTFRPEGDYAVFESFGADRQPKEEIRVLCEYEHTESGDCRYEATFSRKGAMHAVSGDLKNCGDSDIIIAVASDFGTVDNSIVLWESEDYSHEKATKVPIRAARVLSVGPLEESGKNYLFVVQSSELHRLTIETAVFSFDETGKYKEERLLTANEPVRIMSGRTYTDGRYQLAVVNFEGESLLGFENVYIFLGDEDGYTADRRLEFPGCAAVDTLPCDFNDDGIPDVLIVNCAENAPHMTPGSVIYWNSPEGFDVENRKNHFYSETSHGAAIGDFRKCGYLDIIMGGFSSREIKIFEGGPNGYNFDDPKILVLGPNPEEYLKEYLGKPRIEKDLGLTPEIRSEFGQVRWMFAADFNGDGWLDIFVSEICGKRSFIFWGGPDGFSQDNYQAIATDGIASANAADLNGNGYLDLVLACHQSVTASHPQELGKFEIYWGGKDGYKENRKTQLPTPCCNALTIQDFNNDGRLDIYGTAYSNGRCRDIDSYLYFQSEDGMFHSDNYQNIFNHSGCGCMAADFNGDGYMDLAVASHKAYGNHTNTSYIFWGSEDGINETRYTELPCIGPHGMCSVDIGNIMDRSDSEYYYSEAYKTETKATKVHWTAENGKKTWVKIQFRCADTAEALESSEWSESFENNADISSLNLHGYIQYKLELGATCGCGTPRITEVTVDFE